jgi:hypothetical protein
MKVSSSVMTSTPKWTWKSTTHRYWPCPG